MTYSDDEILAHLEAAMPALNQCYASDNPASAKGILSLAATALVLTGRHTPAEAAALLRALVDRASKASLDRAEARYQAALDGRTQP